MRRSIAIVIAGAIIASVAVAQENPRSHGAHEHGHGKLNMAIDGNRVLIELEAPGADIVGFEHSARTKQEREAIDRAIGLLRTPLALFAMPADAACRVEKAQVSPTGGDAQGESHGKQEHGERHMEFHAEYVLACDRPDRIRRVAFPYFRHFAGSRELDITVIDDRGQTRYEVERDSPALELKRTP